MIRWDCCTCSEVKYRLDTGRPEWHRDLIDRFDIDDFRATDLIFEYPDTVIAAWSRPWMQARIVDGYPVEYRVFVEDGEIIGLSSYYPQRPLADSHEVREDVVACLLETAKLIAAVPTPLKYPRFKGRRRFDSVSIARKVKLDGDRLRVPGFGWMTIRRRGGNPYPDGEPVSAVLKREAGKWYAVVCHAMPAVEPGDDPRFRGDSGSAIGVDMNAGQVATSDGRLVHTEPASAKAGVRRLEARAKRLSHKLARQKRGPGRRERTCTRLAKTRRHIAGIRHNWRHHVSREIASIAHIVAIEDLKVKAMTRSAKGTPEEPGRRVRQKAGLNRVVRDTGWGALRSMLEYKAGRLVAVPPHYTSQTCHACGHVDAASRRSQAVFHCVACGHADNADANAAREIRRRGLALLHGKGRSHKGPRCPDPQGRRRSVKDCTMKLAA